MSDNVSILPIWKRGSTAAEFFHECALLAQQHPERFGRVVMAYEETLPTGNTVLRTASTNVTVNEMLGLFAMASHDTIEGSRK